MLVKPQQKIWLGGDRGHDRNPQHKSKLKRVSKFALHDLGWTKKKPASSN
jgi:hypothetical protein